jgi:predicted dehydrogenase
VIFGASWDVWKHSHPPIELYGTEGSLRVPDPNFFGGAVEISDRNGEWNSRDTAAMALGAINWPAEAPRVANNRALGVADLVAAVRSGRPNHTSGRLALHVLEVMDAILHSGETGTPVKIRDEVKRPPVLPERDAARLLPS